MKSRILVAGVVGIAVIAGSGVLAVHMLEKKTEQAVRDSLAAVSTTAETVQYQLFGKKLTLGHVTYSMAVGSQRNTGVIDSVVVDGFNSESLDASFSGLPLVADSIVVSGVKSTGKSKAVATEMTLAELRIEDWYQNLGKLAAQFTKEPWGEAFWAEAYRYRLGMMAYKNYVMVSTTAELPRASAVNVAMAGLMGPAGGPDGSDGRHCSVFFNDVSVDLAGKASTSLKRMELRGLTFPEPAIMARFKPVIKELMQVEFTDGADSPAVQASAQNMGALLEEAYATQAPYQALLLQNYVMTIAPDSAPSLRLDELENTLDMGTPLLFGLRIKGWRVSEDLIPPQLQPEVLAFVPTLPTDGLPVDGSINLSLAPASVGASKVEWSAGLPGLGEAKGSFDFKLNVASLGELVTNPEMISRKTLMMGSDVVYTDNGLLALLVSAFSRDMHITPVEAQKALLAQLPIAAQDVGAAGPMIVKALTTMLEKPGTLTMRNRLTTPMSIAVAMIGVLMDPDALNLEISAQPGPRDFVDCLPAALK